MKFMKSITLSKRLKPRLHRELVQLVKDSNLVEGEIINISDEQTGEIKNFRVTSVSKDGTSIELEETE